jgi:hypothetical protein
MNLLRMDVQNDGTLFVGEELTHWY